MDLSLKKDPVAKLLGKNMNPRLRYIRRLPPCYANKPLYLSLVDDRIIQIREIEIRFAIPGVVEARGVRKENGSGLQQIVQAVQVKGLVVEKVVDAAFRCGF